jgi:molybdate transport system ATP-binding protein
LSLDVDIAHGRGAFRLDARLQAPEAGITVLFGPSGAGKSTLLAAVAGLLRPDRGRITRGAPPGEEVLLDVAAGTFVPARARRFGVVFQSPRLFPHLDVRGNLLFGHARQATPAPQAEIDAIVELLGIGDLLGRRSASLSGGEAQRVAIGRALLASPAMLLLDEPLSALDAPRRQEVLGLLARLRDERGVPMLYVTHRQDEIARLADHVVVLDDGRVAAAGPVETTLASAAAEAQLLEAPTTVIRARVAGHDADWGLTDLECTGGHLVVERVDLPEGAELRLGVRATDVTLARSAPEEVSANNVLEGRVVAVRDADDSWADVTLDCGGQPLLARITRRSADRLAIAPGDRLWALVKSTTLTR